MYEAPLEMRLVLKTYNDGNGDLKVLRLQVFRPAEDWMHPDIVAAGGFWNEVPIIQEHEESGIVR